MSKTNTEKPESADNSLKLLKTGRGKDCAEMAFAAEVGNELSLTAHQNLGGEKTSRLVHLRKDLD